MVFHDIPSQLIQLRVQFLLLLISKSCFTSVLNQLIIEFLSNSLHNSNNLLLSLCFPTKIHIANHFLLDLPPFGQQITLVSSLEYYSFMSRQYTKTVVIRNVVLYTCFPNLFNTVRRNKILNTLNVQSSVTMSKASYQDILKTPPVKV